jgi:hypothetical protein
MNLEWAAGFLEGEGSFVGNDGRVIVVAGQKDPECLYRLQELFGGTIHQRRTRDFYVWQLGQKEPAKELMLKLRPFMSARRKEQIDKALNQYRPYDPSSHGAFRAAKTHCLNGHRFITNAKGIRKCKECNRYRWYIARARKVASNILTAERFGPDPGE